MKFHHLICVALFLPGLPAIADTTLTPIDPVLPYAATIFQPTNAVFTDQYSFELTQPALVSGSTDFLRVWGTVRGVYFSSVDATNVTVGLYESGNTIIGDGDDVLVQPFTEIKNEFPAGPGLFFQGSHLFELPNTALTPGPLYFVQVIGIADAQNGAQYDITVPEPTSSVSMVAGIFAVALMGRRRAEPADGEG